MALCDRCDNHATAVVIAPGRRPERVKLCAKCERAWDEYKNRFQAAEFVRRNHEIFEMFNQGRRRR